MDMEQITREYPHYFSPETMPVPWAESPFLEPLLKKANLSPDDESMVRRFAADGYVVFEPEIPMETIDRATRELDGKYPTWPDGSPNRWMDAWTQSEAVREIAVAPKVLQTLELLYRRKPIPFQTLNFKVGTQQRTHSDTVHFQSHPANWMSGVWVALEDVDADNGPLHYYPKSHKTRLYDPADLDLHANIGSYISYEDFVEAMFSDGKFEKREVTMKKGQALIWSANLYHGGSPIRDKSRTRQSQVTHYYYDHCMYYTPMGSDVFLGNTYFRTEELRDIRTGEKVQHFYKGRPVYPVRKPYEAVVPLRYADIDTQLAAETREGAAALGMDQPATMGGGGPMGMAVEPTTTQPSAASEPMTMGGPQSSPMGGGNGTAPVAPVVPPQQPAMLTPPAQPSATLQFKRQLWKLIPPIVWEVRASLRGDGDKR